MGYYRKKPVVIEAVQLAFDNIGEVFGLLTNVRFSKISGPGQPHELLIHTLEGDMKAVQGDWIIKGVNGEFYPCKPDIFEKTYEALEGSE